eukprot:jgi/Bigna1/44164/e_gw1.90.50.1
MAVTVKGKYLTDTTLCVFGDVLVASEYKSSKEIVCHAPPASAQKVIFKVRNFEGVFSAGHVKYTYDHETVVANVSVAVGPQSGGVDVFVGGSNFKNTDTVKCKFNDTIVNGVWLSASRVQCMAPPHKRGTVRIRVSNNGFDFSTTYAEFTY